MRSVLAKMSILLGCTLLFLAVQAGASQGPDIPIGDSPTFGPANAPVTIIEFIDFQ